MIDLKKTKKMIREMKADHIFSKSEATQLSILVDRVNDGKNAHRPRDKGPSDFFPENKDAEQNPEKRCCKNKDAQACRKVGSQQPAPDEVTRK